jgi:hypothetical protein
VSGAVLTVVIPLAVAVATFAFVIAALRKGGRK